MKVFNINNKHADLKGTFFAVFDAKVSLLVPTVFLSAVLWFFLIKVLFFVTIYQDDCIDNNFIENLVHRFFDITR